MDLEQVLPDLNQFPNQDQNQEEKPKRKRRTKAEIEATTSGQSSSTGGSGSGRKSKIDKEIEIIEEALSDLFILVSGGLSMFVNEVDGEIVLTKSPRVVQAMCDLARQKEPVRLALLRFATVSAYGVLGQALMAMALPIAANHGFAPLMLMAGAVSDETFDKRIRQAYEKQSRQNGGTASPNANN